MTEARSLRIHHLRNATLRLDVGEHRLLVDPMLSGVGALPGFKLFGGGRRRNPLVPLPPHAAELLEGVTGVIVTHEHLDHFDPAGLAWIQARGLPVWASRIDAPNLRKKGLAVRAIEDGVRDIAVEVVPVQHSRGAFSWFLGPVSGVYLAPPGGPSLMLTSDAVLTDDLLAAVERLAPEVLIAPAGAAHFGVGPRILFTEDELVRLARAAPGEVIFNHLEALDHCPTTRAGLRERLAAEGLSDRTHVPEDGAALAFSAGAAPVPPSRPAPRGPNLQKWVTAYVTGT